MLPKIIGKKKQPKLNIDIINRNSQMKTFIYIFIFTFLFSSCEDQINLQNLNPFIGTWELKTVLIGGDGVSTPPSTITINFTEQAKNLVFNGNSTCNFYGGEVVEITPRNSISLSAMFTTEIACTPDILNSYESEYYTWLSKVTQYSVEENKLILSFNDTSLNFEKTN